MKIHASIPQVITRDTRIQNKSGGYKLEQVILLHVEGRLTPLESSVILNNGDTYPVGVYVLDPSSFHAGRYGRIEFDIRLGKRHEPAKAAA